MPISKANLSQDEKNALVNHAKKHKVYPIPFVFNKPVNAGNFTTADGVLGSYFTMEYKAPEIVPIVSIATSFIVTPNTVVDTFALALSYKPTFSMADGISLSQPTDEGARIYQLLSNGGAINDFQVFYPLNWYMERGSKIYLHVYAGAAAILAGTGTIKGQFIIGTMPTGE